MNLPDNIRQSLSSLPDQPGVYLMKDARNKVLYVGKAKNLASRVRTYFTPGGDGRVFTEHLVPAGSVGLPKKPGPKTGQPVIVLGKLVAGSLAGDGEPVVKDPVLILKPGQRPSQGRLKARLL